MQLVQTVAPATMAITLDDAKGFLRVLSTDDDVLIASMIVQATKHVENLTNRQLVSATYELYSDSFEQKMPKNPIQSIQKIEYMDANQNYIVLDNSLYYLYEDLEIGKIEYVTLPILPTTHKKAVKITFTCGYATIPEPILAYIRVKIATFYEFREEFLIGTIATPSDKFIENLLNPYKIKEF
ncbi:MAG: hypothetical protein GXP61_08075 [Epsilonproteobacteria bacterium]|nr:hypothetical protein [Campylobacterota bacterium]